MRRQSLVGALAVLVALPTAVWQGSAMADPAPVDTVTVHDAPSSAVLGETIRVTVQVTTDSGGTPVSAGDVYFDLATDEGDLLFNGSPDVLLGPLSLDLDGEAVFDIDIDTGTLPLLVDEPEVLYVAAMFNPDDYDAYNMSTSETWEIELSYVGPPPTVPEETEIAVTGPATAVAGVAATLTAVVTPSDAVGTVLFDVDEIPLSSAVALVGGVASASYTFASAGESTVRATFIPTNSALFEESEDLDGVDVTVSPAPIVLPPPTSTTTTVSAPASVQAGSDATLSATVAPAAGGTVQFTVDGAPVGAAVAVAGGAASVSHTFAEAGTRTVGATFTPADPAAFTSSGGTAIVEVTTTTETSVVVTGPASAIAGEETTLTATVQPDDVAGIVTFYVDGSLEAAATVEAGAAAALHTFTTPGQSTLSARFYPTDTVRYAAAAADAEVEVAAGTTATAEDEAVDEDEGEMFGTTCGGGRPGPMARRDPFFPSPIVSMLATFSFLPFNSLFQPLPIATPWFADVFLHFGRINFGSDIVAATIKIGPCGTISIGRKGQPTPKALAQVTETTVPCTIVGTGFQCALPDLAPNTEIEITAPFGLPAVAAGRNLGLTGSLVGTDSSTGEQVTLGSEDRIIEVPRRTVLSASLAPVPGSTAWVAHRDVIGYRLRVRNAGVVTADGVRACITVGKRVEILRAKGADVHGRRACWTLPDLGKGSAVTRKVTVVSPTRGTSMTVAATVTPKKRQADPVHLETKLPVR